MAMTIHVDIVSAEKEIYSGTAEMVFAPLVTGEVGILPRHAPFMTLLGQGVLSIRAAGNTSRFRVQGGFLQVVSNTVRVVAEQVQEEAHAA